MGHAFALGVCLEKQRYSPICSELETANLWLVLLRRGLTNQSIRVSVSEYVHEKGITEGS